MHKQEIEREVQQRLPPPCFMCFDWRHSLLYLLLNLLLVHYSLWLFSACCIEDIVKIYEIINTKVSSDFDPPSNAVWKASDCLYFSV